jgi:hypothetical protein
VHHEVALLGVVLVVYADTVVDFARAGYRLPGELVEGRMDWTVAEVGILPAEVGEPGLEVVERVVEQLELVRNDLLGVDLTGEHCMATVLGRSWMVERSEYTLVHLVQVVAHMY